MPRGDTSKGHISEVGEATRLTVERAETVGVEHRFQPGYRPPHTLYSDELAASICCEIANGAYLIDLCARAGMPRRDTVTEWARERPEFDRQYKAAQRTRAAFKAEEMAREAEGFSAETTVEVQAAKHRFDVKKWFLAHTAPDDFGDKMTQELKGTLQAITTAVDDPVEAAKAYQRLMGGSGG